MKFKITKDKAGEWRWSLVAANGRIVADSGEGYTRRGDCENAIHVLQRDVFWARVSFPRAKK